MIAAIENLWITMTWNQIIVTQWRHVACDGCLMAPSYYLKTGADLSSKVLCCIHIRAISQEVLLKISRNMCLDITLLKLLTHLPGTMS